jgi:hypothetical protein
MRVRVVHLMIGVTLLMRISAIAHHSFSAEFDARLPVTLRGTITKVERTNPHGWIFIDVQSADGKVVNWAIETNSPLALARQGVTKDSLPIGTEIIATGFRARNGSPTINGEDIRLPDGKRVFIGTASADTPYADRAKEAENAPER